MFSHIKELFTRPSGYTISRSVRLRSSASAYFNRTPASATNRKVWTWSGWVKRGSLGTEQSIFATSSQNFSLFFGTGNDLRVWTNGGNAAIYTSAVYRDPSAWYHIVLQRTSVSPYYNLYVNGVQVTSFAYDNRTTYPSTNDSEVNNTVAHYISGSTGYYLDGYLTEVNFIDGQALTPSSFGETDSITGVWKAKKYSGTYGTNGFYLNFSDNSSNTATTIGKDYSGNGNNWTPNNISVTSGSTYDSMVDSPTVSAVSSNYAVLNPLTYGYTSGTLSNGNLNFSGGVFSTYGATIAFPSSGKFYLEFQITSTPQNNTNECVGFCITTSMSSIYAAYASNGQYADSGTWSSFGNAWSVNDIIGIAVSVDTSEVSYYKNGTQQGTTKSFNFSANNYVASARCNNGTTTTYVANFGQRPFSYTPPTGYVALNTWNLPDSTIKNGAGYMAATTYTGTGSTQSITNTVGSTSFQPDFVWMKSRSAATSHHLADSVRGIGSTSYLLLSNTTDAESTSTTNITAVTSTGFTVGSSTAVNNSGATYVGWQWKAGGSSSSNTNGSITSTVSVGATQGFSVVTYTASSSASTIGHGLGVAPSMIIQKNRDAVSDWGVYHISVGATKYLRLNTTDAATTNSVPWNDTTPTSTVFSIGTGYTNGNKYVAYCFAAVAGYSAFGSYTGNGSTDGTFVYTGFRPRWLLIKRTTVESWILVDSSRDPYNVVANYLLADTNGAETNGVSYDFVSNGIKFRGTSQNQSGATYIYACFAENPFKNALAR